MVTNVKQLRLFIAFTSECQEERDALRRIVSEDPAIASLR